MALKDLETMTPLEIIEVAEKHLLDQGRRSIFKPSVGVPICAYRSPDGLKCAVGVFISDEEYKPIADIENKDVRGLLKLYPDIDPYSAKVDLLRKLQAIHDTVRPEEWASALASLKAECST